MCAASLLSDAQAGTIVIQATVDEDLRTIHGVMHRSGTSTFVALPLLDPLADLPEPLDDLTLFRTYPGRPNKGRIDVLELPNGDVSFTTVLPRRFGAVGSTNKGLFANGGWYPQPEGLPVSDFEVRLALPPGTTGALGNHVASGELTWTGTAERASLAVVRRGQVTVLDDHGRLLTRGRPHRRVVRELKKDLDRWPAPLTGAVVIAPLRRRLVRPGPGLAYLSDRAYRLTPGLEFAHRRAVTKGVATAWASPTDPLGRELVAAGLAKSLDEQLRVDTERALRRWSWVPQINGLLSSRRMAFYADILDLTYPGDKVADDLAEMYAPHWPGAAVAAQLDAIHGSGTTTTLAQHLDDGNPLPLAMAMTGLSSTELEPFRVAVPRQNLTLDVDGTDVTITRTPAGGNDIVMVRIDGEDHAVVVPERTTLTLDQPPSKVALDPKGHTAQTSIVGDTYPLRYQITAAAGIDTLNFTRGQLYGALYLTLRRQGDTRHLWAGSLSNSRSDLVRVGLAHFFKVGPLVDGFRRTQRLRLGGSSSILDTRFADTDGLRMAVDGSVGWAWDTRVSNDFPLSGQRLYANVTAGAVPFGVSETWGGVDGGGVKLVRMHPRWVLAARTAGAVSLANVPHRLLTLGGLGAMRSIPVLPACSVEQPPPCADLASERALVTTEIRWAPIRNASVPMFLLWGTELQLTAGAEAIVANVHNEAVTAVGATAGILGVGDMLGAEAMSAGVVAGWPLWWNGLDLAHNALPEIYLQWSQAF